MAGQSALKINEGRRAILLPIAALLGLGLSGCDEKMPAWTGLNGPPTVVQGVPAPSERVKSLRELAKKAPVTTDKGERESICRDLAQQIHKEPDSIMRSEILRVLAAYGGDTAAAVLHVAVRDPDADVRVIVCDLWARRMDKDAADKGITSAKESAQVLADMLSSDSNFDVRIAAARGLGRKLDADATQIAVQALGTALDDKNPAMQYRAMISLHAVTGKDFGYDLERWRQYIKTGQAREDTFFQRMFR